MPLLRARLDIPAPFVPKATYALRELAHRMGFGLHVTSEDNADLVYGPQTGFDAALYEPQTPCKLHQIDGHRIWGGDPIAGTYRLLTYQDESIVPDEARDRRGVFLTTALSPARREIAAEPLVEEHAAFLLSRLPQAQAAAPRWPSGKRYALVMSHDADHVHAGAPGELATSLAKAVLHRNADEIGRASCRERV